MSTPPQALMSGQSQPLSQRNVSLRPGRSGTNYNSPRSSSMPAGVTAFEDDLEALIPLETEPSPVSSTSNVRDVLARENAALQKLSSSGQRDRCLLPAIPQCISGHASHISGAATSS